MKKIEKTWSKEIQRRWKYLFLPIFRGAGKFEQIILREDCTTGKKVELMLLSLTFKDVIKLPFYHFKHWLFNRKYKSKNLKSL